MSTSPVGPEDIRAAAEAHNELGPEYSDAVVAAFLDKVDREVTARVEARLANIAGARVAPRTNRRTLIKVAAIGVCVGALIGSAGAFHAGSAAPVSQTAVPHHVGGGPKPAP